MRRRFKLTEKKRLRFKTDFLRRSKKNLIQKDQRANDKLKAEKVSSTNYNRTEQI